MNFFINHVFFLLQNHNGLDWLKLATKVDPELSVLLSNCLAIRWKMWLSSNRAEQGLRGIGDTLKSNILAKVLTDKTSEFIVGRPCDDWGGAGGAGGGMGGGLGGGFEDHTVESTEPLRLSAKIGVVGTEVVEDTEDATEPPGVEEVLKWKRIENNCDFVLPYMIENSILVSF